MTTRKDNSLNLTTFKDYSRKTIKYGLIALVAYLVLRFLVGSFTAYWKATHPEPPPAPTVGFGKLPALNFPASAKVPASYRLETANGRLPDLTDRLKVFFMPKSGASLFDSDNAKSIASKFNFVFEPEIINERTYRFTKTEPLVSTFEIDIRDRVFNFQTDYLSRPDLILANKLPSNYDVASQVKTFAGQAGNFGPDIATASAQVSYLVSSGNKLEPAVSVSNAEFVQVDINRRPIDDIYQIYTQRGYEGVVHAIVSGFFSSGQRIVEAHNYYYPIDYGQMHTYPLRDVRTAWKMLQAGEGLVVNPGKASEAVIRKVSLGYYDDMEGQDYFQPIYVFEGDEDFLAIVAAVDPQYIQIQLPD